MQQEDLWGWNRSFLATHRRSHAPSTLWHLQVFEPGVEREFLGHLFAHMRPNFAWTWGIISLWFLILTVFGVLEVGMVHEEYERTLGGFSMLVHQREDRDTHATHLVCLCIGLALTAGASANLWRLKAAARCTDLHKLSRLSRVCNLHAAVSVLLLYYTSSVPLIVVGRADLHYMQELAWATSALPLLVQLRFSYTVAWLLLAVGTMWIVFLASSAWGAHCVLLICPALLISLIAVMGCMSAHERERSMRAHFQALHNLSFFLDHFRSILRNQMPPIAVEHVLGAHRSESEGGEFGRFFESASVLFARIELQDAPRSPTDLITDLNAIFSQMDAEVDLHPGALKIKTVCGYYMVAAGVPEESLDHTQVLACLALRIRSKLQHHIWSTGKHLRMAFGIHSGPLCAGIASRSLPRYDIFGDTVNCASRMMSISADGEITLSDAAAHIVMQDMAGWRNSASTRPQGDGRKGAGMHMLLNFLTEGDEIPAMIVESCDMVHVKGKGYMQTWKLIPFEDFSPAGSVCSDGESATGQHAAAGEGDDVGKEGGDAGPINANIEINTNVEIVIDASDAGQGASNGGAIPDTEPHGASGGGASGASADAGSRPDSGQLDAQLDGAALARTSGPRVGMKRISSRVALKRMSSRVSFNGSSRWALGEGGTGNDAEAVLHVNMLEQSRKDIEAEEKPWYADPIAAQRHPEHWRHKLTSFVHRKVPLVPSPAHQRAGSSPPWRKAQSQPHSPRKGEIDLVYYEGLQNLPSEDLVFDQQRPFHPVLLKFENPVLERLFCSHDMRDGVKRRFAGSLAMSALTCVMFLVDVPLFLEGACRDFVIANCVGISAQLASTIGLWLLIRSEKKLGIPAILDVAQDEDYVRPHVAHKVLPAVNCMATYFVMMISVRWIQGSDLAVLLPQGRGLVFMQCFSRVLLYTMLLGIDAVWKIPSLRIAYALGVIMLVHYLLNKEWLEHHLTESNPCSEYGDIAVSETRQGFLQDVLPLVVSLLAVFMKRWVNQRYKRRQLAGLVQTHLVREKVEVAVKGLFPEHVLVAQMRQIVARGLSAPLSLASSLHSSLPSSRGTSRSVSPRSDRTPGAQDSGEPPAAKLPQQHDVHAHTAEEGAVVATSEPVVDRTHRLQGPPATTEPVISTAHHLRAPPGRGPHDNSYDSIRSNRSGEKLSRRSRLERMESVDMATAFCPEFLPKVVLLMCDIQGFTALSSNLSAPRLFSAINELFTEFDVLCTQWKITKIETVGDAYLCAAGLSREEGATYEDAYNLLQMALAIQRKLRVSGLEALGTSEVRMRVALHCGHAVAGIVGVKTPRYHLFGPHVDAVMALEAAGDASGVVVSSAFHELFFSEYLADDDLMGATVRGGLNFAQRGLHLESPTRIWNARHVFGSAGSLVRTPTSASNDGEQKVTATIREEDSSDLLFFRSGSGHSSDRQSAGHSVAHSGDERGDEQPHTAHLGGGALHDDASPCTSSRMGAREEENGCEGVHEHHVAGGAFGDASASAGEGGAARRPQAHLSVPFEPDATPSAAHASAASYREDPARAATRRALSMRDALRDNSVTRAHRPPPLTSDPAARQNADASITSRLSRAASRLSRASSSRRGSVLSFSGSEAKTDAGGEGVSSGLSSSGNSRGGKSSANSGAGKSSGGHTPAASVSSIFRIRKALRSP